MSEEQKLTSESTATPLINPTDDDNDSQTPNQSSQGRKKWKVILEAVVLLFFLLLSWGVYAAVPTVFYVLKPILQVSDECCDCTISISMFTDT